MYETLGLETSLKLRFFFQEHQAGLGAVYPIFEGLEHCGHRKIQLSGAVARGLEGNDDIDAPCGCRANDVSINVDSETISTQKKKCSNSPQRKRKKKKVTTKTTRKFAAKTFKVNKCMTSATEILPPTESSDRRRSKRNLQSSGPTFFSVCACNATIQRKKKEKKGNS